MIQPSLVSWAIVITLHDANATPLLISGLMKIYCVTSIRVPRSHSSTPADVIRSPHNRGKPNNGAKRLRAKAPPNMLRFQRAPVNIIISCTPAYERVQGFTCAPATHARVPTVRTAIGSGAIAETLPTVLPESGLFYACNLASCAIENAGDKFEDEMQTQVCLRATRTNEACVTLLFSIKKDELKNYSSDLGKLTDHFLATYFTSSQELIAYGKTKSLIVHTVQLAYESAVSGEQNTSGEVEEMMKGDYQKFGEKLETVVRVTNSPVCLFNDMEDIVFELGCIMRSNGHKVVPVPFCQKSSTCARVEGGRISSISFLRHFQGINSRRSSFTRSLTEQ